MRPLLRGIGLFLLIVTWSAARADQWRMSRPTQYRLVSTDGTVWMVMAMTQAIRMHIDPLGLRTAELTFKDREILILDYVEGRLARMRLRDDRTECTVPDSLISRIGGVELSRTVWTRPGKAKRASDATRSCVEVNSASSNAGIRLHPPATICSRSGCSRVGGLEVLMDDQ